jgi:3-hydroxyacyl-[acyl-carrier-protein] dehydratase
MRWFWIDKFVEFESGVRAKAIKNVSMAEEHLHDHFPGFPVMPPTLMIEGMAQTGGILLGEISNFNNIVVLAKVPKAKFYRSIGPGETIMYDAKMLENGEDGGMVECVATVGTEVVAEVEIMYGYLNKVNPELAKTIDLKSFFIDSGLAGILRTGNSGYTR